MYTSYFKLSEKPFQLNSSAKFFYGSVSHAKGLSYLRYGLNQAQGFVVITGEPGTGKSLLVQTLLQDLPRQKIEIGVLSTTLLEGTELLRAVANVFGIAETEGPKGELILKLHNFFSQLLRKGKSALLIVDEAQNLTYAALEELRMLTNFENNNKNALQVFLIGQQQLRQVLENPDLTQLAQRIIASCELKPLSVHDTRAYLDYRLRVTGWRGVPSFTGEAIAIIFSGCCGYPRLTNILCDRVLLSAYLDERQDIDADLVEKALQELNKENPVAWKELNSSSTCTSSDGAIPLSLPHSSDPPFVTIPIARSKFENNASNASGGEEGIRAQSVGEIKTEQLVSLALGKESVVPTLTEVLVQPSTEDKASAKGPSAKLVILALVVVVGGYALIKANLIDLDFLSNIPVVDQSVLENLPNVEIAPPTGNGLIHRNTQEVGDTLTLNSHTDADPEVSVLNLQTDLDARSSTLEGSSQADVVNTVAPVKKDVETTLTSPSVFEPTITTRPAAPPVRAPASVEKNILGNTTVPSAKPIKSAPEKDAETIEFRPVLLTDKKLAQNNVDVTGQLGGNNTMLAEASLASRDNVSNVTLPAMVEQAPLQAKAGLNLELETERILIDITMNYELGNLDGLLALFTEGVGGGKRQKISDDYRKLFAVTDMRTINFSQFKWEGLAGEPIKGVGRFKTAVWMRGKKAPIMSEGVVKLDLVDRGDRLYITALEHVVVD